MKANLDPKMVFVIVAVVVVGAALLLFKGANSNGKAPLPDPSLFNGKAATTHPDAPK